MIIYVIDMIIYVLMLQNNKHLSQWYCILKVLKVIHNEENRCSVNLGIVRIPSPNPLATPSSLLPSPNSIPLHPK